ncbi:helix-turn-helix domain-containing protein [Leptospira interrogans]
MKIKSSANAAPSELRDMDAPNIGVIIQRRRKERRMTLEQVADISNVSRSMLSQIERGETNPTYAVVWRLTRALGIGLGDLARSTVEYHHRIRDELVTADGIPEFRNPEGKWRQRILSPPSTAGDAEWYELEIMPGCAIESQPHRTGAWEHLTPIDGPLRVVSGEQRFDVRPGDTARYCADVAHAIINDTKKVVHAFLVTLHR